PRGSPAGVITTAALSSKRSTEPSGRRIGLRVRTTTARTTSPFLTPAPGVATFTAPMNTSPTSAVWLEPFRTRIQRITRAPELSATFRRLYGCIILPRPLHDPVHAPALVARERPRLRNLDRIADVTIIRLIVRFVFTRPAQGPA